MPQLFSSSVYHVVGVVITNAIDMLQACVSILKGQIGMKGVDGWWVCGYDILGLVLWPLHKEPLCSLHKIQTVVAPSFVGL